MADERATAQLIDDLVDMLYANASATITNPDGWRLATRRRLSNLEPEEIGRQHAKLTGQSTSRPGSTSAADYHVREIDLAISLGVHLAQRRDHDTGTRTVTDTSIAEILTDEHGPSIAGRALAMIDHGSYRIAEPRNAPHRQTDPTTSRTVTLAEYLDHTNAALPPNLQDTEAAFR